MSPEIEAEVRQFIDYFREEDPYEGTWSFPGRRTPTGAPPLVISLARFQSFRARTEAALVQELADYLEEAGLQLLHYIVQQDDQVLIW